MKNKFDFSGMIMFCTLLGLFFGFFQLTKAVHQCHYVNKKMVLYAAR